MCSMKKSKRALPGQAFILLPDCPEGLFLFLRLRKIFLWVKKGIPSSYERYIFGLGKLFLQVKKGLFIRVRL